MFSANKDGDFDIYVMVLSDLSVEKRVKNDGDEIEAVWSPDGRNIAFTSNVDGDQEIFIADDDGGNITQLTFNDVDDLTPTWSPDSDQIAFSSRRDGESRVFTMDTEGGNVSNLIPRKSSQPNWAYDGIHLAYSCYRERLLQSDVWDVCTVEADGDRRTRLAEKDFEDVYSSWASSNTHLVLSAQHSDSDSNLYIMDLEGNIVMRLTNDNAHNQRPAWSPPMPPIEIGEIVTTDSEMTNVIAVNTVELPNCQGTSDLTVTRTFTQETERRTTSQTDIEARGGIAGIQFLPYFLKYINIEAEIYKHTGIEDSKTFSESISLELRAAPGTSVAYEVEWVEVSTIVIVELRQGDNYYFEEYAIVDSLEVNVREPTQRSCDDPES